MPDPNYPGTSAPRIDRRYKVIDSQEWIDKGVWVGVKSSNVAKIMYDKEMRRLHVEFNSGGVGWYENVSESVAKSMFDAPSIGKYLDKVLKKGGYTWKKP